MKKLPLIVLLCLSSIYIFGQLEESKAIDNIFSEWDKPNTPGCALGIIKDGELIYAKGYGLANMEYDIPNSANSVFRIASTSKQFTAASIVLLAEQGKLSLDHTLKSYFPDFPEYANNITIQHLLNHTSGIRDYLQLAYLKGIGDHDFYEDEDIMNWLLNQTNLNFAPGEEHLYSNSGYWLLGQIVKEVAGVNMADFAKKEIFEPLGMNNTHFHNDHNQIVKNRASGYYPIGDNNYQISMTTLDMIGDGGIFTSINDIKKWDDAFYNSTVLSEAFWSKMTKQGVLNNGKVISYASGLSIGEYKSLKTIRHGGAFVGFRAELLRFPDQRFSIAIFTNRGDASPSRMADQIADIMLKNLLKEEVPEKIENTKIEPPKEEFQFNKLIGNYEVQAGAILTLSIKNDSLNVLQNWNKSSYNIVKTSGNTYQIPGDNDLIFTFSNLKDDKTQTLTIIQNGRETITERKKEIDTTGINSADYVGVYHSEELDITYNIKLENNILMASIENMQGYECTMADIDQFNMSLGMMKFYRINNVVSGFDLDSGRVKNLKFRRK